MNSKLIILSLLFVVFLFGSCKKVSQEPILPPSETMELKSEDFSSEQEKFGYISNWTIASITVGVWSSLIKITFAIPIIVYKHALDQEPQRIDKDIWLWQYDVNIGIKNYKVKLYAFVDNDDEIVSWQMYINDFNWFVGENNLKATEGYWIFYSYGDDSKEKLKIEWTFDYSDSVGTSKYIIVEQDSDNYNSYLYYGNTMDEMYNCFFDIFKASDTSFINIQWNDNTKIGRIKTEKYFGDLLWHCWDENLQNCECPSK